MDKEIITPRVFEAKQKDYEEALKLRRLEIKRLAGAGWTQQRIADHFALDISRVNRILNSEVEKSR